MTETTERLRKCRWCNEFLPLEKFYKSPSKGWYDSYCLECKPKANKAYRERDPERYKARLRQKYNENKEHYRDLARRSMYGMPLGAYELLDDLQVGRCAICGAKKSTRTGRKLSVDHDEEKQVIRGLLCTSCNQGIGAFRHNVHLMDLAIEYLLRDGYTIDELKRLIAQENKTGIDAEIEKIFEDEE